MIAVREKQAIGNIFAYELKELYRYIKYLLVGFKISGVVDGIKKSCEYQIQSWDFDKDGFLRLILTSVEPEKALTLGAIRATTNIVTTGDEYLDNVFSKNSFVLEDVEESFMDNDTFYVLLKLQ